MADGGRWWRPEAVAARLPALRKRAAILAATRRFFAERGFDEVETPALQVSPGLEPHLRAFATALHEPFGGAARRLYLHTSPEFAMKKLLAGGLERIFQIARVFRDGERSPTHHPEFTMLEWYRAGAAYTDLMDDCEALLRAAAEAAGAKAFSWRGASADPFAPWRRLTVAEAFAEHAGVDLLSAIDDPLAPDPAPLAAAARRLGLVPGENDRWDDVFFRIFLEFIEPNLGRGAPVILYDYPVCMAALSRPKPSDPRLAERFELYVCGLELANAFGELTDPAEQRRRFAADMALKERLYGERYPVDPDFLAALDAGLPASAGIALGLDRLVMLAVGAADIAAVLWAEVDHL
ncbi:MAG: EF-P lysine aminoacylase GenX [Rhodospirillales bacterium]|nr:EF-P lysine aminoacylase GenX [Rhodospirillales bacterium]